MEQRLKLLVVGSGGREHALAWKLAQSSRVAEVLVAPGNAGTAVEPKCRNVAVAAEDIEGLIKLADDEAIGFVVVGPEGPLAAGLVDALHGIGRPVFGPTKAAAEIEASKAFTKELLIRNGIPTAQYRVFCEIDDACAYIANRGAPIVVKADGLAAGKGVVVAMTVGEAQEAVRGMLGGGLGAAGAQVVIEDYLEGEEASYIVVASGTRYMPLATAQDHKRVGDGDSGPNTGGMGAYSPAPVVTAEVDARIRSEVIEPTLRAMAAEGRPFTGFLYAGLMIAPDGSPRVIEFNARLGDPETQPILMRLKSDLLDLLEAAVDGSVKLPTPHWYHDAALGVVMAAPGYPGFIRKGDPISGLDSHFNARAKVFHAGTTQHNGQVVTNGGRVLCVCGLGPTVSEAQSEAYSAVSRLSWDGAHYRKDIGYRAVWREEAWMKSLANGVSTKHRIRWITALLCLSAAGGVALADNAKSSHHPVELLPAAPIARPDAQTVLGRSERVSVMEGTKSVDITANLDTKEAHSTLYVADMKYFNSDSEQWVRFTVNSGQVVSGQTLSIERKVLRDEHVKERGGGITHRPWVDVNLCIGKHSLKAQVALADRSAYTAQLKLGTEDIDKVGRVDTALQFTAQPDCPPPAPPPAAANAASAP